MGYLETNLLFCINKWLGWEYQPTFTLIFDSYVFGIFDEWTLKLTYINT